MSIVGIHVDNTITNLFPVTEYTKAGITAQNAPSRGLTKRSVLLHVILLTKKERAVPTTNSAPKIESILLIVRKSFKCLNRHLNLF